MFNQQLCIIFYSLISSFWKWNLNKDNNLNGGNLFPFRRCKVITLFVLYTFSLPSWWGIVHFPLVSKLRLGLDSKTGKLIEIRRCEHHFLRPPKNSWMKRSVKMPKIFSLFIILIFYLQYLDEMSSFLGNVCQSQIGIEGYDEERFCPNVSITMIFACSD